MQNTHPNLGCPVTSMPQHALIAYHKIMSYGDGKHFQPFDMSFRIRKKLAHNFGKIYSWNFKSIRPYIYFYIIKEFERLVQIIILYILLCIAFLNKCFVFLYCDNSSIDNFFPTLSKLLNNLYSSLFFKIGLSFDMNKHLLFFFIFFSLLPFLLLNLRNLFN